MWLRLLVQQFLRQAAEEKLREALLQARPQNGVGPTESSSTDSTSATASQTSSSRPMAASAPPGELCSADEPNAAESAPPADVLFLFATAIEAGGLIDRLGKPRPRQGDEFAEHVALWNERRFVVVESGVGAESAARAAAAALRRHRPAWVVSAGFAGGLHADLRRGEFLLADTLASEAGGQLQTGLKMTPEPDKGWHVGKLLTVPRLITSPAEKQRLGEIHGALACDMETFAVAEVCREFKTRLLSARVISDARDDALPPEVEHLLRQKTLAARLGAAAGAIFQRPGAVRDLWRLRDEAIDHAARLAKLLLGVAARLP